MPSPRIVLAGLGPNLNGLIWETDRILRIGRQQSSDVVLNDVSVDRHHAEIKHQGVRWMLRDLANSPVYPTAVNHAVLCGRDRVLQNQDLIQIGSAFFRVVQLELDSPDEPAPAPQVKPAAEREIKSARIHVRVEAATQEPWDRALDRLADQGPRTMTRAHQHLANFSHPDELLRSIIGDAVSALRAQRGALVLADRRTGQLVLSATVSPKLQSSVAGPYSKTIAQRCFTSGESVLCQDVNADPTLVLSRSIRHGAMSSIICAVVRTPEKRLGVLHLDRGIVDEPFTLSDLHFADAIAASVAVAIDAAQFLVDQREQYTETMASFARAVEVRDPYTGNHTKRVTDYSLLLADELKLAAHDKYNIQIGSPLHDIGKISIADAILRKPGKLSPSEFEQMKTHTVKGASMLDAMRHLEPMVPIVRSHHERWDGTGYPDGLGREQIPQTARIVSIADAFAAMTSERPFRPALTADQAFLELIARAGTHFDPTCVYAFVRLRPQIEAALK